MHFSFNKLKPNKQKIYKMTICVFPGIWTLGTAQSSSPGREMRRNISVTEEVQETSGSLETWYFSLKLWGQNLNHSDPG